jgi:hypothetical protein
MADKNIVTTKKKNLFDLESLEGDCETFLEDSLQRRLLYCLLPFT